MEEIDKVLEALNVVERYEEYLFNKSWGRALIAIGFILPLGVIVNMNAVVVATALGIEVGYISILATTVTVMLCFGFIAYTFIGAWRTVKKKSEEKRSGSLHGPLIGITWFVSFTLASLSPESMQMVALLWAASVSCILSFVILRATGGHIQDQLLLYLGLLLGIVSLPLMLLTDQILVGYLATIAFSACFLLGGIMMHRIAARSLQGPV
jgi:hypothetical protein